MINIYKINDNKFKSIYLSVNFTMNVNEKENSQNAVLASILSKSCKKYNTQKEVEKYLYGLYGSVFNVNVEKYGDLYNMEFLLECVNKKFLPNNEDVVNKCLEFLYDMVCNPNINENAFDEALTKREKEYILEKIRTRKDDKLRYAVSRAEELMCYPDAFGMYLYGDEEIIQKITPEDIYNRYLGMLSQSCITIIATGNLNGYADIENTIKNVFGKKLSSKYKYNELVYDEKTKEINNKINEREESQETAQSVITLGLRVNNANVQDFFALNVYNAILGSTPSSKLFQNVREKESLAYTVRSRYYRFKSIFVIYAGIERKNYDKAKEVILKELKDMETGNITEEEFKASKESIIADLKEWNDSKIALSKMLLSNLIVYKDNVITLDKMIEEIEKITLQDVIDIASKIELEEIFLLGGVDNV